MSGVQLVVLGMIGWGVIVGTVASHCMTDAAAGVVIVRESGLKGINTACV